MKFEGFCTYPHGFASTLGLLVSSMGGFAAAGYAFASCRFVIVSFVDDEGSFEDVLSGPSSGGDVNRQFRVAAGLFQWLNPSGTAGNFDQGACVGYRTTMLETLSEPIFEVVRIMAVLSTLLSIMVLVWIIIITTLSMRRREIWFLTFFYFLMTSLVGLTFLVFRSSLCQDVGVSTSCELDEGGLVAIASCILWFVGLLVSCIFIKPVGQDLVLIDGELRSEFAERQGERKRQAEIKMMVKERRAQERAVEREQRQQERERAAVYAKGQQQQQEEYADERNTVTPIKKDAPEDLAIPNTQQTAGDDEGMEVYLSRTLDQIEDYVEDDDDDDDGNDIYSKRV